MGLLTTELILVGVVLLVAGVVLAVYLRRRLISHGSDVVMCGFRGPAAARWNPSLLRMTSNELQVYPLFGWTARPRHTWTRRSLDLEKISPLEHDGGLASVVDQSGRSRRVTTVGMTDAGEVMRFDLALGPIQYTALRYWVESSPPTPNWAL